MKKSIMHVLFMYDTTVEYGLEYCEQNNFQFQSVFLEAPL